MIEILISFATGWIVAHSLIITISLEVFKLQTVHSRITLAFCVLSLAHTLSQILR